MPILLLPVVWIVAELVLLIVVAGKIGALQTLGLLLLAFAAGIVLIRGQQISMLGSIKAAPARAAANLREGGFRVLAALLLIIPGFLSDAMALVFLLPPLRMALGAVLLKMLPIERFTVYRRGQVFDHQDFPQSEQQSAPKVIEGEVLPHKEKE